MPNMKLRLVRGPELKVRVHTHLAGSVAAGDGIGVVGSGGVWTVSLDYVSLGTVPDFSTITPAQSLVAIWDGVAETFKTIALDDFVDAVVSEVFSPTLQGVTTSNDTIASTTDIAYVNRAAPSTTGLTLPDAAAREGLPLSIIDYSQSVTAHTITLTPFSAGQKVMRQPTWALFSNSVNLAAVTLIPIVDPENASNYIWIIAP